MAQPVAPKSRLAERWSTCQPAIYRSLVDAAWSGLRASGHGGDTILIGETANRGILEPTPFTQELYCVRRSLRPLTGNAAAEFGCPQSGDRAAFGRAHPGLFAITGWAHHPYGSTSRRIAGWPTATSSRWRTSRRSNG